MNRMEFRDQFNWVAERIAYFPRSIRYPDPKILFYHYFNAEGTELGYWSPDFAEFDWYEGFIFETPRVWGKEFLDDLDKIPMDPYTARMTRGDYRWT